MRLVSNLSHEEANPMTQATRVLSTPPTNTPIDTHRRRFLAIAAGAGVASVGALAVPGQRIPS